MAVTTGHHRRYASLPQTGNDRKIEPRRITVRGVCRPTAQTHVHCGDTMGEAQGIDMFKTQDLIRKPVKKARGSPTTDRRIINATVDLDRDQLRGSRHTATVIGMGVAGHDPGDHGPMTATIDG